MLQPQLEHNKRASDRQGRHKIKTAVGGIGGTLLVFAAIPNDVVLQIWIPSVAVVIGMFGWFESQRLQVFRRDLRERREEMESA